MKTRNHKVRRAETYLTVQADVEIDDILPEISDEDLIEEVRDREIYDEFLKDAPTEDLLEALINSLDLSIIDAEYIKAKVWATYLGRKI